MMGSGVRIPSAAPVFLNEIKYLQIRPPDATSNFRSRSTPGQHRSRRFALARPFACAFPSGAVPRKSDRCARRCPSGAGVGALPGGFSDKAARNEVGFPLSPVCETPPPWVGDRSETLKVRLERTSPSAEGGRGVDPCCVTHPVKPGQVGRRLVRRGPEALDASGGASAVSYRPVLLKSFTPVRRIARSEKFASNSYRMRILIPSTKLR